MSTPHTSALVWIGEEVRITLEDFDASVHSLGLATNEQRPALLAASAQKIATIMGALDVAHCEAVLRYASALQQIIFWWRDDPSSVTSQAIAIVRAANRSLCDYLSDTQKGVALIEIALFADYQRLCGLLGRECFPFDLWSTAESDRCVQLWSREQPQLLTHAQQRLDKQGVHHPDFLALDSCLLNVIRQFDPASSTALQRACDQRALQDPSQALVAALLSSVVQATVERYMELDIFLKRYLLTSLNWLKSRAVDEVFLHQSVFFAFLAWQAKQRQQRELTSDEHPASDMDDLAKLAQWRLVEGAAYSLAYFDTELRAKIAQAQQAVAHTAQVWADYCLIEPVDQPTHVSLSEVCLVFEKMDAALQAVHPSAARLGNIFSVMIPDKKCHAKREVQVEIASLLIVIESMLSITRGREQSELEAQFSDLAKRIEALKNNQPVGEYEPWMLRLQKHRYLQQAMTSMTDQLGHNLRQMEGILERAWGPLGQVDELSLIPDQLGQMQAIGQLLKLDDFASGVAQLRDHVQVLLQNRAMAGMGAEAQKQLAADVAHLGLMLNTWSYRPESLAGEHEKPTLDERTREKPEQQKAGQQEPVQEASMQEDSTPAESTLEEPLEHTFLQEAHVVLQQANRDIEKLRLDSDDHDALVDLRRAFHTLKGGARVVGLVDYGQAAWLLEQQLNEHLTQAAAIDDRLLDVCAHQVTQMQVWTQTLLAQPIMDASAIDWQLAQLQRTLDDLRGATWPVQPMQLPSSDLLDLPVAAQAPEAVQQTTVQESPAAARVRDDETQIKRIGDLRISIPLYQAYLNESDEWSRQLALSLSEWALDDSQALPAQALMWAHSLAGSSATVGFQNGAQLAKLIERVIERIQTQSVNTGDVAPLLSHATDELRRLLHQFAAGFMKAADPTLLAQLQAYVDDGAVSPPAQAAGVDTEMLQLFDEESDQLMLALGAALRAWAQAPQIDEHRAQALRTLHTLKGSARLVGEQKIAQAAHDLESKIEALAGTPDTTRIQVLLHDYDQITGLSAAPTLTADAHTARLPSLDAPALPVETMRVQTSTIDRLVNQTGELMTARARLEAEMARSLRTVSDMSVQVQRLRDQLREMELQTESQLQSRQAQVGDGVHEFDPLELDRFTRTQELARFMAEALSDISTLQRSLQRGLNSAEDDLAAQLRQTRDLQRHLLRTRMVEFDSINERLHRLVRLTSQELGKSVDLSIHNGTQEIDRSVLERMLPVFEHLLRNAVVHGIELPHDREAKGKPLQGQIRIQLTQQSNDVILTLQDDGKGIDYTALREKARQRRDGFDAHMDDAELIFMSGLSTASEVSELAGRGIGMDVVRSQILALGGLIEVHSTGEVGTTFRLVLPLTTAVTQVVLVRAGTQMIGIAGNLVSNIVRVKAPSLHASMQSKTLIHGDQTFGLYDLGQLLQYSTLAADRELPTQSVILLQSAAQSIALRVDEVLGNQEVMVKNLGTQLAQMPGLSGMTVLPTGQTVLIYNPVALAAVYGVNLPDWTIDQTAAAQGQAGHAAVAHRAAGQPQAPLVMVVDDSITMRRVLQRFLQREGYRVVVAADGLLALDALRLELPLLVLSDVEMPRMDGFELLRTIRSSERMRDLPVVMITSRIADKHRDHAKALGANEYLGKPYSEDELLQVLRRYAGSITTLP